MTPPLPARPTNTRPLPPAMERPEEDLLERIRTEIEAVGVSVGAKIDDHAQDDVRRHDEQSRAVDDVVRRLARVETTTNATAAAVDMQTESIRELAERVEGVETDKVRAVRESLAEARSALAEVHKERADEAKQLAKEAREDARTRRNLWIGAFAVAVFAALGWLAVYLFTHVSATPQRVAASSEFVVLGIAPGGGK